MRITTKIHVRYRDIDSMGHVNNAVYLNYFEQARISYFNQLIGEKWDWQKHGILVARHEIDYKRPILLNDDVISETWCDSLGSSSMTFMYEVKRKNANGEFELCSIGKTILVCFDNQSQQKIPVPQLWKEKINL